MIPRKKHLLTLLILFFCFLAGRPDLFAQYRFDSWTTDNGLPQNGVREIAQTPDGYLWFTTFDGLVRFDGVRFTNFNKANTKGIINNRLTGLYCDREGTLFATTAEDGILTIYRSGVFSSYSSEQVPGNYIEKIKPDESGELRFLVEDTDRTSKSWYYLRDGQFVFSEREDKNNIKVEYQGKSGTLWTLTPNRITQLKDGKTTVYPYKVERLYFLREVFEDSDGALWVGGAELLRLKDGRIENLGKGFPQSADFHSFWEETDGSVWFANGGRSGPGAGLVRYRDGKMTSFGKDVGLSDSSIFDVFKDREGIIWLATNKGINRLKKSIITTYNSEDGLSSSEIYPIYRDSHDDIWIGSTKGLNIYRNGKFEAVNLRQTDLSAPEHIQWRNGGMAVQSILEDSRGKMWVGVSGGIFVVDGRDTKMLADTESYHVSSILEDKAGNIWATSNKGILRFRDYKLTAFYSVENGLPNEFMTVVYEDSVGRLWFGGLGGLSEFRDGRFINYTVGSGLTGNYVRSIYEDGDGTLWIGTYGEGLSRFKDGQFFNYRVENGLYNDDVFAIEEDKRGNFWISSNQGIYRVKKRELNDLAEGKIERINSVGYGKGDGMLSTECNGGRQPASIRDREGKFWFPTQEGIVVIDPSSEIQVGLPPSVVIESASVEREQVDIGDGLFVKPGQRNIEIKFTGISLKKSEQIKFKYKLEGHDPDWIDADTRRTAYYSYLPPGTYLFRVRAANSDGVWSESDAALILEMKPFFYQTNWFFLACLTGAVFGLFAVWKISVYQLEAREKRLARLVAERTKELKKANEELQHLANSDGLTGVGNRRRFEEFLADEWNRAVRSKSEISLILIDIDHFKPFNDTYGHQAGDDCLKRVAAALKNIIKRPADLIARFGGEEFAVVLGGTGRDGARKIAEQAMTNVAELNIPHRGSGTSDRVTISIGVATTLAKMEMTEADLIKAADKALYRAKEDGRNRISFFDFAEDSEDNDILEKEFLV
ncbi:MAG: diguanylate cyclase [Pyrinomonadaceae bacterium]